MVFTNGRAEGIAKASANHRGGRGGPVVLQAERSDRDAHHVQNALERLRQHLLKLAADEAGRGQVQAGKRQHVPLDAPAFLFVNGHHHQHAGE